MDRKNDNNNCEVMDILTDLIVVIILKYIHTFSHNVVHLKLRQCNNAIISQ